MKWRHIYLHVVHVAVAVEEVALQGRARLFLRVAGRPSLVLVVPVAVVPAPCSIVRSPLFVSGLVSIYNEESRAFVSQLELFLFEDHMIQ